LAQSKDKTKALPAALPLEEVVLGALLLDKEAIFTISSLLSIPHFYKAEHRLIYSAILSLYNKSNPIDLLTVAEALKEQGKLESIGGPYYLVELTNRVASSANVEEHAKILIQKWMRREGIAQGYRFINSCFDPTKDIFSSFDIQEAAIEQVKGSNVGAGGKSNLQILQELDTQIERNSKRGSIGLALFGIPILDEAIGGAEEDDFILIAGRPSMGKSSLLNSAAKHCILNKIPALFWSSEMTNTNTICRVVAALTDIPYDTLFRGLELTQEEQDKKAWAYNEIAEAPVFFEELAGVTVRDFKSRVVTLQKKHNLKAAFFDRIGLFSNLPEVSSKSTSDQIGANSKIMRQMALQLKLPIIALNQLNRQVEQRPLKIPMLSDLRNSGDLEQDATKVILLYRPEYYGIMQDENGEDTAGAAYFICPKNRNGNTGTYKAAFKGDCMYFKNEIDKDFKDNKSTPPATLTIGNIARNRTDEKIPF
jgi:replicative DNA helicase